LNNNMPLRRSAKTLLAYLLVIAVALAATYTALQSIQKREEITKNVLRITTTTSLYITGLLDAFAEDFNKKREADALIQFIAVGTGEALRRASQGDADMVFVHAPSLEKEYIAKEILKDGEIIAYNYFIIVGPVDDPAGAMGRNPVEAFRLIFRAGEEGRAVFVSRGDRSGTHIREMLIWGIAGLDPRGRGWYLETGAGMAETLRVADERLAYTLTDIGTWIKLSDKIYELIPLVEEDKLLINIYRVYLVNPEKIEGVNEKLAEDFLDFVSSDDGKAVIMRFKPMFTPAWDKDIKWLMETWEWLANLET